MRERERERNRREGRENGSESQSSQLVDESKLHNDGESVMRQSVVFLKMHQTVLVMSKLLAFTHKVPFSVCALMLLVTAG